MKLSHSMPVAKLSAVVHIHRTSSTNDETIISVSALSAAAARARCQATICIGLRINVLI